MQQHQRQQSLHLRVVDDGGQVPGEPDGFGGQIDVAGLAGTRWRGTGWANTTHSTVATSPGVASPTVSTPTPATVRLARLIHWPIVVSTHQVGRGDLLRGQYAHRAQGQRDCRRSRRVRVRAGEVGEECAIVGADDPGRWFSVDF